MKKILTILLCMMTCQVLQAGRVTEAQARQKAQQFLSGKLLKEVSAARLKRGAKTTDPQPFYVFNVADNGGYVIVSGDDRTKAILAFSEEGSLDLDHVPENMKWWLGYYERVITSLGSQAYMTRGEDEQETSPRAEVPKLIQTYWKQTAPYNNDCPVIGVNDSRCLTGCLATAMAQVMNKWQWPKDPVGPIPAYDPYKDGLFGPSQKELPATQFNWETLEKDDVNDQDFKKEVAKLCRYCGQSVRMGYSIEELGGSTALDGMGVVGLVKYFGFDKGTRSVFRGSFSDKDWEDIIYHELQNGRPVIYSGQTAPDSYTGAFYGHTFICDGYTETDEGGFFHINWGWGSQNETSPTTWCKLSVLNISRYYFTEDQSAVIGIQPPTEENVANHKQLAVTKFDLLISPYLTREEETDPFPPVYFSWVIKNTVVERTTAEIYFVLAQDNQLINRVSGAFEILPGWNVYNAEAQLPLDFPLADGVYRLFPSYRMKNDPLGLTTVEGADYRYIEMTVDGLKMTLKAYPEDAPDQQLKRGDADGDGEVTEKDMQLILAAIESGRYLKTCDVNTDGMVTVADVVALYDIIDNNNNSKLIK